MATQEHRALAFGDCLGPGAWSGTVASVHARALNILRDDGLLVSIVAEERSMTAMSIHAGSVFERPLYGGNAEALLGRPAESRCGRLLIPGLGPVSLLQARQWEGSVPVMRRRIAAEEALLLEHALVCHGKPGGMLGLLVPWAAHDHHLRLARNALAERRPEALVGLGPGTTPAGDDFLAGALLAGTLWSEDGAPAMDTARIEQALPGTAPAGRTLLWLALRHSFPSYLCTFVAGLANAPSKGEVEEAVRAACSHGETSGTDALTGFCLAIRQLAQKR